MVGKGSPKKCRGKCDVNHNTPGWTGLSLALKKGKRRFLMKNFHSILSRVLLGGSLILALTPCVSCGGDKPMAMSSHMRCAHSSCCQSHQGCQHQTPKDCRHLMNTRVEGVVFAKSIKPTTAIQALRVPDFTPSTVGPTTQVFHHLLIVQSPPGSSLILRI